MIPNRADSYCCTGGGAAMYMAECAKRRLEVATIKAEQITKTGAAIVATACHNCVDGLTDVIKKTIFAMILRTAKGRGCYRSGM